MYCTNDITTHIVDDLIDIPTKVQISEPEAEAELEAELEPEAEYKYRNFVDGATSIQCKLNSIIKGGKNNKINLVKIFHNYVLAYNKIAIEGLHLFNIYILDLLKKNELDTIIDTNTIARCMRVLVDDVEFRESKDLNKNKEAVSIKSVKNNIFQFQAPDNHTFKCNGNSYLKPLDSFATTSITNIHVGVERNFKKYQCRYIIYKLRTFAPETVVSNGELKFVLNCVQKLINDEKIHTSKYEQKITKITDKLNTNNKLNDFIKSEKETISHIFQQKIKFCN